MGAIFFGGKRRADGGEKRYTYTLISASPSRGGGAEGRNERNSCTPKAIKSKSALQSLKKIFYSGTFKGGGGG